MSTILVTGAGGFVGGRMAQHLAGIGHEVLALHRSAQPPEQIINFPRIQCVKGDLTEPDSLPPAFDALVHCAAEIPARCPDPDRLVAANAEGSAALFSHAVAAGARRIVFCSSMSAFGVIEADMVTPDTPSVTPDAYGRSKLSGEQALDALCHQQPSGLSDSSEDDLRGVSIRLPGVVGAGSHDNFLSGLLQKIQTGRSIQAFNPESLFNNIVYVGHLAEFVATLLEHMPQGHTVTTIAATAPLRIREVIDCVAQAAGTVADVSFQSRGHPFQIDPQYAVRLGFQAPTVQQSIRAWVGDVTGQSRV